MSQAKSCRAGLIPSSLQFPLDHSSTSLQGQSLRFTKVSIILDNFLFSVSIVCLASRFGQQRLNLRSSGLAVIVMRSLNALLLSNTDSPCSPSYPWFLIPCLFSLTQQPNLKCAKLIKYEMKREGLEGFKSQPEALGMCELWVSSLIPHPQFDKHPQYQPGAPREGPIRCKFPVPS